MKNFTHETKRKDIFKFIFILCPGQVMIQFPLLPVNSSIIHNTFKINNHSTQA